MSLNTILLIAAVILFIIAALVAGGVISGVGAAWIGYTGLACFAAAHLPIP
jgi:hypothetical protein